MKNLLTIVLFTFFMLNFADAQNVAINTDGTNANSDAILHLKSTSKGLLIPSMTTSQRTSISNVSNGLMVYDTQTNSFWFRDSGTWNEIVSGDIESDFIEDADGNTKIQVEEGANDDEIRFDIAGEEKLVIKENANGEVLIDFPVNSNNSYNTFLGHDAGLVTDATGAFEGSWNTFIGFSSGKSNTIGTYNTFLGRNAGIDMISGKRNTFLGVSSGANNTSGENNLMVGAFAGESVVSGSNDTYLGYSAGRSKTGGGSNTMIGYEAGKSSGTGTGNVFLGYQAGFSETGDDKLYIDNSSETRPLVYGDFSSDELQCNGDFFVNTNSSSNSTMQFFLKVNNQDRFSMGYNTANSYFVIKDEVNNDQVFYIKDGKVGIQRQSPTNTFEVNGTASKASAGDWLANSDARLKKNITNLDSEQALQKLMSLQGVTYEWNDDKTGNDRPEGIQYGFTAQNVQEIYPELVSEDNLGYLQTSYGTYDAMYVEAIRELLAKVEKLEARVNQLEKGDATTAAK